MSVQAPHAILREWNSHRDPDNLTVAVEFSCGSCCKRARNAKIADVVDGVLVLVARCDEPIIVEVVCPKECAEKEFAKIVIIPLDKISSVEISEKRRHHRRCRGEDCD